MFENRALRQTFGAHKKEVTRDWRKLHNEELRALYRSPNILRGDQIRKDEMGRSDVNIPLGVHTCRWQYNIKVYLQVVGWDTCPRIKYRRWALVKAVMNLRVP